ncbi:MAG: hypothetical protein GY856_01985 [bacterium]|nr:hypothetical protein [bacterium]
MIQFPYGIADFRRNRRQRGSTWTGRPTALVSGQAGSRRHRHPAAQRR